MTTPAPVRPVDYLTMGADPGGTYWRSDRECVVGVPNYPAYARLREQLLAYGFKISCVRDQEPIGAIYMVDFVAAHTASYPTPAGSLDIASGTVVHIVCLVTTEADERKWDGIVR